VLLIIASCLLGLYVDALAAVFAIFPLWLALYVGMLLIGAVVSNNDADFDDDTDDEDCDSDYDDDDDDVADGRR